MERTVSSHKSLMPSLQSWTSMRAMHCNIGFPARIGVHGQGETSKYWFATYNIWTSSPHKSWMSSHYMGFPLLNGSGLTNQHEQTQHNLQLLADYQCNSTNLH
jgi:hypothetical protein